MKSKTSQPVDAPGVRRVVLDGIKIMDGYRIGLRLAVLDNNPRGLRAVRRELEEVTAWIKRARAAALALKKAAK